MAWTYSYDTATPLGSTKPTGGDDRIRETKLAVQERLNDGDDGTTDGGDHYWPLATTEVTTMDAGQHRFLTFQGPDPATNGVLNADELRLYTSDVTRIEGGGIDYAELHVKNENNDVLQLTWSTATELELYHPYLRLAAPIASPTSVPDDHGIIYTKDVDDKAELHFVDEDDQATQLTKAGVLNITAAAIAGADTNIVDDATLTHTAGVLEIKVPAAVDGDDTVTPLASWGEYAGNSTPARAIDAGFTIRHLVVKRVDGGSEGGAELINPASAAVCWSQTTGAILTDITITGTTFVLSADDKVNGTGKTYYWFASGERV